MFVFFTVAHVASAQKDIDSLESKLRESLSDSLRITTLIKISSDYQYVDLKKSFEACEKAVQLSETKKLSWGKSQSYLWLATLYALSGDFVASAKYNDLALGISFQLKDSASISKGYNNLGRNYSSFGKYDEAYFYYTQSYRISSTRKDSRRCDTPASSRRAMWTCASAPRIRPSRAKRSRRVPRAKCACSTFKATGAA